MDDNAIVQRWRQTLREGQAGLRERYFAKPEAFVLLHSHCRLVDRILRGLWKDFAIPPSHALVAVGGYGRGELYPHSDVDVLILRPEAPSPPPALTKDAIPPEDSQQAEGANESGDDQDERIGRFLSALWDVGFEVGHSARTIAECRREMQADVTVLTTLLENRLLAGSHDLYRSLMDVVKSDLDLRAFYDAKVLEQQQRHIRHHDLASNLEPNIKESPGGLRDLQTVLWIARAAGIGWKWSQLAAAGLLTRDETRHVTRRERVLQHLRIRLHYLANRREDRLVFDLQNQLAASMGIEDDGNRRASEHLMQRYYRAAKAIRQSNVFLLQNLQVKLFPIDSVPHPIDRNFHAVNEFLDIRRNDTFEKDPHTILESFLTMQRHPGLKGMSARTLRALWQARRRIDNEFRRDPVNRAAFMQILREPRGITHELRRMNQYGILGRYLPVFGRIVGQMQHDLFHVYTVDEHILMVVRNLRRFTEAQHAHEYPLCSRLIAEFERIEVLYLAGLFHDIAKGRGGDHSKLGMADATRFCRAHGLSKEDTELVTWLVEQHLMMSATAQKQDLSDPDVIRAFADKVGNYRRLVALYLLTVADIRGTSPKVWNAWKAKLLEDLFRAARRLLNPGNAPAENTLQARQERSLAKLRAYAISEDAPHKLWDKLDDSYFLRHDEKDIVWHTRQLYFRVDTSVPVVKARLSPIGEGLQVMIYAPDEKSLFARICGFFQSISFSIVEAKIYTTRHGYALDSFQVMDPARATSHYRDLISYIEHELDIRLKAHGELPAPCKTRLSRQVKYVPMTPEVKIRPDEKGAYYYLNVVAGDRPGLLYRIARVLDNYDINLYTAKINTLGERAEDTFLVNGDALRDTKKVVRLETELLQELQP